jgi:hypothetical protein
VVLIKAALGTRGTRLTSAAAGIRSARGQRDSEQQGERCPRRSCASCVPALDKWGWSSSSSVGTGGPRSAADAGPLVIRCPRTTRDPRRGRRCPRAVRGPPLAGARTSQVQGCPSAPRLRTSAAPGASPVASHLKEVSKDPARRPRCERKLCGGLRLRLDSACGKLGRRLLGRRVPRPATQATRAMRVSGRPMLLALLLLLSTVGDRGRAQSRGPADRQTLLRLLVELVQELKKFHIGDSKRLQLLGESDFALGRREATDYGADQEEQRVGECSSV